MMDSISISVLVIDDKNEPINITGSEHYSPHGHIDGYVSVQTAKQLIRDLQDAIEEHYRRTGAPWWRNPETLFTVWSDFGYGDKGELAIAVPFEMAMEVLSQQKYGSRDYWRSEEEEYAVERAMDRSYLYYMEVAHIR